MEACRRRINQVDPCFTFSFDYLSRNYYLPSLQLDQSELFFPILDAFNNFLLNYIETNWKSLCHPDLRQILSIFLTNHLSFINTHHAFQLRNSSEQTWQQYRNFKHRMERLIRQVKQAPHPYSHLIGQPFKHDGDPDYPVTDFVLSRHNECFTNLKKIPSTDNAIYEQREETQKFLILLKYVIMDPEPHKLPDLPHEFYSLQWHLGIMPVKLDLGHLFFCINEPKVDCLCQKNMVCQKVFSWFQCPIIGTQTSFWLETKLPTGEIEKVQIPNFEQHVIETHYNFNPHHTSHDNTADITVYECSPNLMNLLIRHHIIETPGEYYTDKLNLCRLNADQIGTKLYGKYKPLLLPPDTFQRPAEDDVYWDQENFRIGHYDETYNPDPLYPPTPRVYPPNLPLLNQHFANVAQSLDPWGSPSIAQFNRLTQPHIFDHPPPITDLPHVEPEAPDVLPTPGEAFTVWTQRYMREHPNHIFPRNELIEQWFPFSGWNNGVETHASSHPFTHEQIRQMHIFHILPATAPSPSPTPRPPETWD
jgi:hypothetical protein